jgi:hypothetical protein
LWIGDASEIRAKRVRKQKTDRQDAQHMLQLLMENRFPKIWVPSGENRDLLQLLWHQHVYIPPTLSHKKMKRTDLPPTGLLIEGDYPQNSL